MRKLFKNKNGITLIALVITIVVLIILAAVAINLSLGNNGIFNRAKTAKEQYSNAQTDEMNKTEGVANMIDAYSSQAGSLTADKIAFTPKDSNWHVSNVKEALDYLYEVYGTEE